jgi:GDP-L-fucose synthase
VSYITEILQKAGCVNIFVPRNREYNLVENEVCKPIYKDSNPDSIIHHTALVGELRANQENPWEG